MDVFSLYLPPACRREVLHEVVSFRGGDPCPAAKRALGGDLNVCLEEPRNEEEAADAQTFQDWMDAQGVVPLTIQGPTQREGSRIDCVGGPRDEHWLWHCSKRWFRGLSDHACVVATRGGTSVSTARHCNPWAMSRLSAAAVCGLRAGYRTLDHMFGIAGVGGHGDGNAPPTREHLPLREDYPCLEEARGVLEDAAGASTGAGMMAVPEVGPSEGQPGEQPGRGAPPPSRRSNVR